MNSKQAQNTATLFRIAMIGTLVAAGSFLVQPAVGQTQKQSQTLGGRAPGAGPMRSTRAGSAPAKRGTKRNSRAECAAQAKQQKLRGRKRTAFIRECMGRS